MYPTHIHDKSNGKEGNKEVWQPGAEIYLLSLTIRVVIPEKSKNFVAKRNDEAVQKIKTRLAVMRLRSWLKTQVYH